MSRAVKRQLDQTELLKGLKSIHLNLRVLASLSLERRPIAFWNNTLFYYIIFESKYCFSMLIHTQFLHLLSLVKKEI